MMKKSLTLAIVAMLAIALSASAHDPKGKAGEKTATGTISKIDATAKTLTVSDSKGASWALEWSDSTKIMGGELKEGAGVSVGYSESDGKMWATWIRVQEGTK
jgi:Cu/Ag efflux protein CusF